jgi:hypothetical protein
MTRSQLAEAARRRAFGLALSQARLAVRRTQAELARKFELIEPSLTEARLGLIERGTGRPRRAEIAAIVHLFPQLATLATGLSRRASRHELGRPVIHPKPPTAKPDETEPAA